MAREFSNLTREARKGLVENLFVEMEHISKIFKRIDMAREDAKFHPEPNCLMIVGGSGYGKSTLLKRYRDKYPCTISDYIVVRPVVYVSMKTITNIPQASVALLRAMEVPGADKGNHSDRVFLLATQINLQKVEVILVDEYQHIVEASGVRTIGKVGDFFKEVAKDARVPFVFAGMPSSEESLKQNEQLRSLTTIYPLSEFSFNENEERFYFRRFLAEADKMLPFERLANLSDVEMARRIFCATDGNLRKVATVIRGAAYSAIDRNAAQINMSDLCKAYAKFYEPNRPQMSNPFLD